MKTAETIFINAIEARGRTWRMARGTALISGLTAVCFLIRMPAAAMASLYMMAIVLQSLDSEFAEAAALSFVAAGCLDYFFMDPLFSLTLAQPSDLVALCCLLAASLVTTRIQAGHHAASQEAAAAKATAKAEMLRSVVLDALAHETKTPLAAIVTAAGGLRESVPSSGEQQLAEMIETEAMRLGELTSRLLRVARLDQEEVRPRMERVDPVEVVSRVAQSYVALWPDREFAVRHREPLEDVVADAELIGLALSQLLENACKYSPAGSLVEMEVTPEKDGVSVTIWNEGGPIALGERSRMFERQPISNGGGTGLGLYVARKIVLAHGGDLVLTTDVAGRVGFRLTLGPRQGSCSDNGQR